MAAVQPARLKKEIAALDLSLEQPAELIVSLVGLVERYADRSRVKGRIGAPASGLPEFYTPASVLNEIILAFTPLLQSRPIAMLAVIDLLWAQPTLEARLIAVSLAAGLPQDSHPEAEGRLVKWLQPDLDEILARALLKDLMIKVYAVHPADLRSLLEQWLTSPAAGAQSAFAWRNLGILALEVLAEHGDFDSLPGVLTLVGRVIEEIEYSEKSRLLPIFSSLIGRSPGEVFAFFRQHLALKNRPALSWLVRRCFDDFSPGSRAELRRLLESSAA